MEIDDTHKMFKWLQASSSLGCKPAQNGQIDKFDVSCTAEMSSGACKEKTFTVKRKDSQVSNGFLLKTDF